MNAVPGDPAEGTTPAANSPISPAPPRNGGSYTAEVISGPRGPLAIYHFVCENRSGRRLLVLKLDHYGDFLIGFPALKRLREAFPADHITLVCGSWNVNLAKKLRIADEVHAYDFFPENGALWSEEPLESVQRLRDICRERFDIALDLRVDEDTRFLLEHIDAGTKCGIGSQARHPFLDVVLPSQFERRENDDQWLPIDPDRFESRMPSRQPLFHENDFSVTNTHLVYGPYIQLPQGRFRVHFGLQLLSPLPRFSRVEIVVDVTRGTGSQTVATGEISWTRSGDPRGAVVEFSNNEPGAVHEFRIHARGRPILTRLRFFGVRLELLGGSSARFKRSELHIGEQLSLLVDLIQQRTCKLYPNDLFARRPAAFDFSAGLGASGKRIVVAPVSNSKIRDWGIENYARLIALLLEQSPSYVVLVGSKAQRDQLEAIVERNGRDRRVINIAGSCDWSEIPAIVRKADLVISNNSGVAHLAAACGVPVLTIYSGSHQPQEWGPRGNNVRAVMAMVPCSPCGHDRLERCINAHMCMKQIAPESIADHAIGMLWGAPITSTVPPALPPLATSPLHDDKGW